MLLDGRYGLRDVMNSQIYRLDNATPLLYWKYANATNLELSQDAVYATGGRGAPRRISFFGTKTGTVTFETQIFSAGLLGIILGTEAIKEATGDIFRVSNAKVVNSGGDMVVTLPNTPLIDTFPTAFKFVNGVITTTVPILNITNKEIELDPTFVTANDEVQVFYQWRTSSGVTKISVDADKNPPYVKLIGDALLTDELTGAEVPAQFKFYKVRAVPNVTLSMANSGDPTTISVPFDIFGYEQFDGSQPMFDITLYEDEGDY